MVLAFDMGLGVSIFRCFVVLWSYCGCCLLLFAGLVGLFADLGLCLLVSSLGILWGLLFWRLLYVVDIIVNDVIDSDFVCV